MRYKADITAGSLKVPESRIIADLLLCGINQGEWNEAILDKNVLQARSPETARRLTRLIRRRLETMKASLWRLVRDGILTASSDPTPTVESSYTTWITQNRDTIAEMMRLEEENNRLFIDAYGLADELTPDVPIEQITLTVNPAYRYGGKLVKQQVELQTFDEKLRHYADQRISLDLDDGVKVNYGKFGDLLAEVKAVTGKKKK
jgi:hypothetical protein